MDLENGKLPPAFLDELLRKYTNAGDDPRVLTTPMLGDDAAVIDMGRYCMVSKMDPITMAVEHLGYYVVNINANDVVTKGAIPRWFQSTLLFPEGTSSASVEKVFADIKETCSELNIFIVGGHTEITPSVKRPVAIGNMMGEVLRAPGDGAGGGGEGGISLVSPGAIAAGDAVVLVKGLAIEGTALVALEREDLLSRKGFDSQEIRRCKGFLRDPGINASRPSIAALRAGRVHAMHDPTEGGLGNALIEMAGAYSIGLDIDIGKVPIYPETRKTCDALGLDPMFLLASGAMVLITSPGEADPIVDAVRGVGEDATVIGKVVGKERGITLIGDGGRAPLGRYRADEILKVL